MTSRSDGTKSTLMEIGSELGGARNDLALLKNLVRLRLQKQLREASSPINGGCDKRERESTSPGSCNDETKNVTPVISPHSVCKDNGGGDSQPLPPSLPPYACKNDTSPLSPCSGCKDDTDAAPPLSPSLPTRDCKSDAEDTPPLSPSPPSGCKDDAAKVEPPSQGTNKNDDKALTTTKYTRYFSDYKGVPPPTVDGEFILEHEALYKIKTPDGRIFFWNGFPSQSYHVSYEFKGDGTNLTCLDCVFEGGKHKITINPGETAAFVEGTINGWRSNILLEFSEEYYRQQAIEFNERISIEVNQLLRLVGSRASAAEVADVCIEHGLQFIDFTEFPPEQKSLFQDDEKQRAWMRPSQSLGSSELFVENSTIAPNNIGQGALGNCWLLASVAAVAGFPENILRIFNRAYDNSGGKLSRTTDARHGIYRLRLNKNGWWTTVIVDTFLPVVGFALCFAKNVRNPTEPWPSLLEKAYAKLHGSYKSIKGGDSLHALQDLTGWPSERMEWDDTELFAKLMAYNRQQFLMTLGTSSNASREPEYESVGLLGFHAYTLIQVVESEGFQLCKICDPNSTLWNGDWSDKSSLWEEHPETKLKCQFEKGTNDGTFWMSWNDVRNHFTGGTVCYAKPHYEEIRVRAQLEGGVPSLIIKISVKESTRMFATLNQIDQRGGKEGKYESLCLSLVYPFGKGYTRQNDLDSHKGSYLSCRDLQFRISLSPCKQSYYLVPLDVEENKGGDFSFVISLFAQKPVTVSFVKPTGDLMKPFGFTPFRFNPCGLPSVSAEVQVNGADSTMLSTVSFGATWKVLNKAPDATVSQSIREKSFAKPHCKGIQVRGRFKGGNPSLIIKVSVKESTRLFATLRQIDQRGGSEKESLRFLFAYPSTTGPDFHERLFLNGREVQFRISLSPCKQSYYLVPLNFDGNKGGTFPFVISLFTQKPVTVSFVEPTEDILNASRNPQSVFEPRGLRSVSTKVQVNGADSTMLSTVSFGATWKVFNKAPESLTDKLFSVGTREEIRVQGQFKGGNPSLIIKVSVKEKTRLFATLRQIDQRGGSEKGNELLRLSLAYPSGFDSREGQFFNGREVQFVISLSPCSQSYYLIPLYDGNKSDDPFFVISLFTQKPVTVSFVEPTEDILKASRNPQSVFEPRGLRSVSAEVQVNGADSTMLSRVSFGATWKVLNKTPESLFTKLLDFSKRQLSTTLGTSSDDSKKDKYERAGLLRGHQYTLIKVIESKLFHLCKFSDPSGATRWVGNWSDESPLWKDYPDTKSKCQFEEGANDGTFWMSWYDAQNYFTEGAVCYAKPYCKEIRAWGQYKDGAPSLIIKISVKERTRLFATLETVGGSRKENESLRLSFAYPSKGIDSHSGQFFNGRELQCRVLLNPCEYSYYIIPHCNGNKGSTFPFVISLFAKNPVTVNFVEPTKDMNLQSDFEPCCLSSVSAKVQVNGADIYETSTVSFGDKKAS